MNRVILFFMCLHLSHFSGAQAYEQFTFKHYSTNSGLASNQVFSTVQDELGYIWIGGTNGLQRFDGNRYVSFMHEDNVPSSIPSNPITQLLIDRKGRLWVLFFDGKVGIFNTKTFTFHLKKATPILAPSLNAQYKRLIKDEYGNLFYLFQGIEIITWSEAHQEFSYAYNFFKIPPEWKINGFAQQPGTKKYWFGLVSGGMAIFDQDKKSFSSSEKNVAQEPALKTIDKKIGPVRMLFDSKSRLWFIWWETVFPYICCYDTRTNSFERYELISELKSYHEIQDIFEQKDGSIWATGSNVFARFSKTTNKFHLVKNDPENEHGISYEFITNLNEDRYNNIWVSTNNNGLYTFAPAKTYFTNVSHMSRAQKKIGSGSPMSFIQTKWNTILCGTWEDGLYQYNQQLKPIPLSIKNLDNKGSPFIWSMFASKDSNTIWMGSQPGIYALNQDQRASTYYDPAALEHRTVRQVVEDKQGNVWLGMHNFGLFKWNIAGQKNLQKIEPVRISVVPTVNISKLLIDRKGWLWIATAENGVYVIDPVNNKLIMHLLHSDSNTNQRLQLPENAACTLLDYDDSTMLICLNKYLVVYNRKTNTTKIKFKEGTFSGYIAAAEKSNDGYIWIGSTSGLYRVNLQSNVILNFSKEDGLRNDYFITASSAKLPDGRLLFGTTNQFIAFDPSRITFNAEDPEFTVTRFEVMNRSMRVDSLLALDKMKLDYNENAISIYFSSMTYDDEYVVRYKLDGLDKDWISADERQQATYSYLPPGTYTFHIASINWKGEFKERGQPIIIQISRPFWLSWWFYSIVILMLGAIIFVMDKDKRKRKAAVQQMRSSIAGNLHEEINTALNNINILSAMARQKADAEPQKSKEFIEQIHTKSNSMILAMNDMLWSISPENDSMEKTLARMQEHIEALNSQHNTNIDVLVDEQIKALKLDMQFRYEAFWLFKESINGLVKAGVKDAKIFVALDKNCLIYTVQFNNDHTDMQQLNNLFQRQDMLSRLENIKAKRSVQLHRSNSLLEIKVPIH